MIFRHLHIYIAPSNLGGRGVFAKRKICADEPIEICPVVVLPPDDLPKIHSSKLHDYYFLWGDDEKSCAIALGYGSLYNHSYTPNAEYEMNFEAETLDIYALRDIEAEEEITFNYNGVADDSAPVWFDK